MDELFSALAKSVADGGPLYAAVVLVGIVFLWKVWPSLDRRMQREDEREDRREQREAQGEQRRADRDREMAELQGQWLEQYKHATAVQEQSNAVMGLIETKMDALTETLRDSKQRSSEMGRKVDEIHAAVLPVHGEGTD